MNDMKKHQKLFRKINECLNKKEREEFNEIRTLLFSGIDRFNMPYDHLSNSEKEGLEKIQQSLALLPILSCCEKGLQEEWYFG